MRIVLVLKWRVGRGEWHTNGGRMEYRNKEVNSLSRMRAVQRGLWFMRQRSAVLIRALVHDSGEMALSLVLPLTSHLCVSSSFYPLRCVFSQCFFVLRSACWRACVHSRPWPGTADTLVTEINNMHREAVENKMEVTLFGATFGKLAAAFCIQRIIFWRAARCAAGEFRTATVEIW